MAILSSGTYTYVVINASSGTCGTCTSTLQPHPSYSSISNSADTVVQLNAVTIGGFNGLNS
jgi:hypothetical protein